MSFIVIAVGLSFFSLIVSFSYHVAIHSIVDGFDLIDDIDYSSLTSELSRFYVISDLIQVVGIISIFGIVLVGVKLVTKVRFDPLVLPFAIIIYLVGIFMAMVFSNSHYYVLVHLQAYDSTFQVNSFFSWLVLNYPYFVAVVGGILMVLGYAKAPGLGKLGGGSALEVG